MLISVIVPIYKVEKYLCRCIDSIINQSFSDFELVLVDDGSPDNCGAICDDYATKDSRIIVIHKENGGLSSARNAGLDVCRGEYVYFVDSDDYIDSSLLSEAAKKLDGDNTIVSLGFVREDEDKNIIWRYTGDISEEFFYSPKDTLSFICNVLTDYRVSWNAWSKIYSRRIIEKYNIRFKNNKEIYAEDLYFNLCYFPYVKRIVSIKEPMYHYIDRKDSITGEDESKINIARFEKLCMYVKEFYAANNESDYFRQNFSLVYYRVMLHAVTKYKIAFKESNEVRIRRILIDVLFDYSFFKKMIHKCWHKKHFLYHSHKSIYEEKNDLNTFLYYADGHYTKYVIDRALINHSLHQVFKGAILRLFKR